MQWQHKSTTADTVLEVRKAYIEVLRTSQNLDTARRSLQLLERQHRDASLRLEQGLIARNDLLRVAVEMATAKQNVVAVLGELVVARQKLSRSMGTPLGDDDALAGVTVRNTVPGEVKDLQEEMLTSRSELKYLQSLLAAQKAEHKAVYGEMLPDVDLSYSYDTSGNHLFPESSDSGYDSEVVTMVEASWTLFRGFKARHELAARHQEVLAIKEEIRATEDRLLVQLSSSLEGYKTARTNLETAQASLELAEENYRVNETRLKAQVATTVDLLDAQEFLTRARNEEVKAQYDLYTAEAVIDRVLERNNP